MIIGGLVGKQRIENLHSQLGAHPANAYFDVFLLYLKWLERNRVEHTTEDGYPTSDAISPKRIDEFLNAEEGLLRGILAEIQNAATLLLGGVPFLGTDGMLVDAREDGKVVSVVYVASDRERAQEAYDLLLDLDKRWEDKNAESVEEEGSIQDER